MIWFRSILYFLLFTILLPGELLIWGRALDSLLKGSYLSRKILLNPLFDYPRNWGLLIGIPALFAIGFTVLKLGYRSHNRDSLLYCGFPCWMLALFLYFKLPCSIAICLPLIILAAAAVWFAYRPEGRPDFLLPADNSVSVTWQQRVGAFFQISGILLASLLIFQEGFQFWLAFPELVLLPLLPLAGILLPKPGLLREYIASSVYALVFCTVIYGTGQLLDTSTLTGDFGIIAAYIYLELVCSLGIRTVLPKIRNRSLLILGLSSLVTRWIMPPVCSPWIVTLSMYILYLLIDNRAAIWRKLVSRTRIRHSAVHIFSWEEYAAQGWCLSALLAAYLAGPERILPLTFGLVLVLAGGLLRSKLLHDPNSDHIILRNFPYTPEIAALLISVMFFSSSCQYVMTMLGVYAAASCLMQVIWNSGSLIGGYSDARPSQLGFRIFCYTGICFLMVLLFFFQTRPSILLGFFCILTGLVRIGDASFEKNGRHLGVNTGWVLIVLGQFIFVSPVKAPLPKPEWSSSAAIYALLACTAFYIQRLIDFINSKRRLSNHENEK